MDVESLVAEIFYGNNQLHKTKSSIDKVTKSGGFSFDKMNSVVEKSAHGLRPKRTYGPWTKSSTRRTPSGTNPGNSFSMSNNSSAFEINRNQEIQSKTCILSTISEMFDPSGFLAPAALLPKSMLLGTWKMGANGVRTGDCGWKGMDRMKLKDEFSNVYDGKKKYQMDIDYIHSNICFWARQRSWCPP